MCVAHRSSRSHGHIDRAHAQVEPQKIIMKRGHSLEVTGSPPSLLSDTPPVRNVFGYVLAIGIGFSLGRFLRRMVGIEDAAPLDTPPVRVLLAVGITVALASVIVAIVWVDSMVAG